MSGVTKANSPKHKGIQFVKKWKERKKKEKFQVPRELFLLFTSLNDQLSIFLLKQLVKLD